MLNSLFNLVQTLFSDIFVEVNANLESLYYFHISESTRYMYSEPKLRLWTSFPWSNNVCHFYLRQKWYRYTPDGISSSFPLYIANISLVFRKRGPSFIRWNSNWVQTDYNENWNCYCGAAQILACSRKIELHGRELSGEQSVRNPPWKTDRWD